MTSLLILMVSMGALLQFFILYSHALVMESRGYPLSECAREMIGSTAPLVGENDFERLLKLIALCPAHDGDQHRVLTVSAYFNLLGWLHRLFSSLQPAAAKWVDSERNGCVHFAAMILDRRIAYSRVLVAQQTSTRC